MPILRSQATDVRYVGHYFIFPRLAIRLHTLQLFIRWLSQGLGVAAKEE